MSIEIDPNLTKGQAQSFIPEIVVGIRWGPPLFRVSFEVDVARSFYSATLLGQADDLGVIMVVPTVGVVMGP